MKFYSEYEARNLVIRAGLELVEKKLIARTWGNISARINESEFVITPSGRAYEDLTPDDLVKVEIGTLKYDGEVKPSSEKGVHSAVYSLRKDCSFVIHTHQFYASAVCAEGTDTDFAPCAKYGLSGTKKLMNNVAAAVEANPDKKAFLMTCHGAVAAGDDYDDAFAVIEQLEEQCKTLFESNRHEPQPGAWIDDYAQMFGAKGNPNPGEDEAAVEYVREKNRAAASYVSSAKPIPGLIALLEHTVYTTKYSKLK